MNFPSTNYHVVKPLGIDDLLLELLEKRLNDCTEREFSCDSCEGTNREVNL